MCVCVCVSVCVSVCVCMCVCVCVCGQYIRVCVQMQLVHVPLSSWHNAVLGIQLGKVDSCLQNI